MTLGDKLRQVRLQKGIPQTAIQAKFGHASNTYVSDVEIGRYMPSDEKLRVWAKAIGLSWSEMEDIVLEAKLEGLGVTEPSFTMMFKDIPKMTGEEKQSLIRAYEAVLRARAGKGAKG